MQAHTRKHHINSIGYHRPPVKEEGKDEGFIDWREAAREVFGDTPGNAINLRGLRNREGLTQKELAECLGTNQANISKMERGIREISLKIAKKLSKVFDIDYRLFL